MKKYNLKIKLLLLSLIDKEGNLNELYNSGFEYIQINDMINDEINRKNAFIDDGKIRLTEKGKIIKNNILKNKKIMRYEKIILPKFSSQLDSMSQIEEIFIPSIDELFF